MGCTIDMIALDTNMLLAIRQKKVDVFGECLELSPNARFIAPKQVLKELLLLSTQSRSLAQSSEIALMEMKRNHVTIQNVAAKNADEALEKLSTKAIIATNDKELRKRIRRLNGKTIFLRKNKMLRME